MMTDTLYPILIAAGCMAAVILFARGLKRRDIAPVYALPFTAAGLLLAFILGKAFFLLFNCYQLSFAGLFSFAPSEFSFTGCLVGLVLGVALSALAARRPVPSVLDSFALPCCILAAFVRFAEAFAGDLGLAEMATFGLDEISDGSALAFFPFAVRDQWGQWLLALSTLETIGAVIAAILVIRHDTAGRRVLSVPRKGTLIEPALFMLCAFGLFFETAKISGVVFYYVHIEQLLSALVMLGLLIRLCSRLSRAGRRLPWLPAGLFLLYVALNGFSQYFLDKAWRFSGLFSETVFSWLSSHLEQVCYSVMLLTAVCMLVLYHLSFRKDRADTDPKAKAGESDEA